MKQTIDISLDVSKIDKTALYESPKTGKKYLNISVLIRDEKDQYGNDGFIVQDIPQAARESGERGEIVGNWKTLKPKAQAPAPQPKPKQLDEDGDEIPF